MFSVIKLGGCNGSGKTTVARAILKEIGAVAGTWKKAAKSPNFYSGRYKGAEVNVLGSYETACGGMDTISDKLQRLAMIQFFCSTAAPGSIIFFEGLMTGKTYGAIGALSEQHVAKGIGKWLYTFLDTPFEACAARVVLRRLAAGNEAPFDPERTMRSTYDGVESLMLKVQGKKAAKIGPQPYPHPTLVLKHSLPPKKLAIKTLDAALELLK